MAASIQPLRHWQLPGPTVKPLPHDAIALQSAVRSGSPQAPAMLAWVQERVTEDVQPSTWDELLSEASGDSVGGSGHYGCKVPLASLSLIKGCYTGRTTRRR